MEEEDENWGRSSFGVVFLLQCSRSRDTSDHNQLKVRRRKVENKGYRGLARKFGLGDFFPFSPAQLTNGQR